MDEIQEKIRTPVDATYTVAAKQSSLCAEVQNTRNECQKLQNNVKNIIAAVIASKSKVEGSVCHGDGTTESSCSSKTSVNTVKSLNSVHEIINSDEAIIRDGESSASDGIPELNNFIEMVNTGKIDCTDELLGELYNVNVRVDTVTEVANNLQHKWCEIDTAINTIKTEINDIKQYIKIENLLLHNFPPPPKEFTSLQYSQYVANLLNKYLPQLPVKVKWEHISTAHTLPTKTRKSNVIVVRFANRNVKEAIFNAKSLLPKHLAITEHLTENNLSVLKKAQDLFGYRYARTDNCKVFINLYGKSYKVSTIVEVHKLFVDYCEFIGSDQSELPSLPPAYISSAPTLSHHTNQTTNNYASIVKYGRHSNPNNPNRQSSRQKKPSHYKGYRGKPSTGYSVYNRKPLR